MKLVKYVHRTVTQGDWSVGCMTGHGIKGAQLNVFRSRVHGKSLPVDKWMRGWGDGQLFPSTDAAMQWAFDHGYLRLFFYPELRARRKERAKDQRFIVVSGHGPYGGYEDSHGHWERHSTAAAMVASLKSHGIDARIQRTY